MLVRAITAFVALPGVVAFLLPVWIGTRAGRPLRHAVIAAIVLGLGTLLLLWCVREFYVAGRGTLAPWAPPRHLVTSGPYRWSRNPMYLGVITLLVGWCVLFDSRTLLIYTLAVTCAVHIRVLVAEEPWAARTFGAEWERYRRRCPPLGHLAASWRRRAQCRRARVREQREPRPAHLMVARFTP